MDIYIYIKKKKYIQVEGIITYSRDRGKGTAYCEYKFTYNDKEYNIKEKYYGASSRWKVGDSALIYIEKDNPNKFLTPGEVRCGKLAFLGLLLVLVFLIVR